MYLYIHTNIHLHTHTYVYTHANYACRYPTGIGISADDEEGRRRVYVSDQDNNRIQVFDGNGSYLTQWGSRGQSCGKFDGPVGLYVDDMNDYTLSDTHSGVDGHTHNSGRGGDGSNDAGKGRRTIQRDVYVCDYKNSRVIVFREEESI